MVEDAAVHTIAIISLKQQYAGHAKQAALIAAGLSATGLCLRFAIVVDDDIDPFDTSRVLWALGTRCDPEDDIDIVRRCWSGRTVPLRSPEKKQTGNVEQSMAIILACKPFYWIKDFPPSVESSPQQRDKVLRRFPDAFAPGMDEIRVSDAARRSGKDKKGEPQK
jgi:4-hydroxy-3-polyprenylbenzoate decarboxylase